MFLQLLLFTFFFSIFAYPMITRYLKEDVRSIAYEYKLRLQTKNSFPLLIIFHTQVTVVVNNKPTEGIPAPTISIRAVNPVSNDGLRRAGMTLKDNCTGVETSVEDCIKKNTFNQEDVLHDITLGWRKEKLSLINNESLQIYEDFGAFFLGRYYTFNLETKLTTKKQKTQLSVSLYHNFTYQLLIYDPKFFVLTASPSLPTIQKTVNPNTTSNSLYFLKLTEVVELDTRDDPCNEDPNYDFQSCVAQSLASNSKVICNLSTHFDNRLSSL